MRRRRLIIFAFYLRQVAGHHLNEVLGFLRAAETEGLQASVHAPTDADPEVLAQTGALPLIPNASLPSPSLNEVLERMGRGIAGLDPVWDHIETAGLQREDVVLFTHGNPMALFDLTRRLAAWAPSERPTVFVRFLGGEFRDVATARYGEHAPLQAFVADILAMTEGQERVHYTINSPRQSGSLTRLAARRTFLMPVHKYYGDRPPSRAAAPESPPVVYIHVTETGAMEDLALAVAERILGAGHDVDFVLKFCRYDGPRRTLPGTSPRVRIETGELSIEDYFTVIGSADIAVFPYSSARYRVIVSGAFCEAVAFGAAAVVPADTWMADRVTAGEAAGVLFAEPSVDAIAAAIGESLRHRATLFPAAAERAKPFRESQSAAAGLSRILELAGKDHCMTANIEVGDLVDFTNRLGSRRLLGPGWSMTEEGLGVWSGGDRAAILLRPSDDDPPPSWFEAKVQPFLAGRHDRLGMTASVNGVPAGNWEFRSGNEELLRIELPPSAPATRDLDIEFAFDRAMSPAELGLSADPRRLGILLRELRLVAIPN